MDPTTLPAPRRAPHTLPSNGHRSRTERRIAHRVPCQLRLLDAPEAPAATMTGETVNLSALGLAVQLGHPVQTGLRVEILLSPANQESTWLSGHVIHSRRVASGTFEIGVLVDSRRSTPVSSRTS